MLFPYYLLFRINKCCALRFRPTDCIKLSSFT
nr:MAG TPA: hypothetical protein [Caudoviricetes sp.]DAU38284.1 MAG TPA: hypothetical protein [Caudoviricetes sp.]